MCSKTPHEELPSDPLELPDPSEFSEPFSPDALEPEEPVLEVVEPEVPLEVVVFEELPALLEPSELVVDPSVEPDPLSVPEVEESVEPVESSVELDVEGSDELVESPVEPVSLPGPSVELSLEFVSPVSVLDEASEDGEGVIVPVDESSLGIGVEDSSVEGVTVELLTKSRTTLSVPCPLVTKVIIAAVIATAAKALTTAMIIAVFLRFFIVASPG